MEAALRKLQDRIQQNFHLKKIGGGSKFFGGARRGEGVELSMDLNSTDKDRQKNAVKRIIANMTLGRDVSQLFVEVVKLGQTLNVELKKLVYLYVLNTAKLQPEKALMAVNTFLQDAVHASPIIRALAIRTMMCIRVECVMEYTLEPLRRAVTDVDPYVRKTAALALGKLYHQNAKIFAEQNFMQELVRLLADPFPVVSSNACAVLAEISAVGNTPVDIRSEWVNQLLNALPECSEWGQGHIMDLLALYVPPTAEAADTLLARIVPRLAHTNPAVVMATIKVIVVQAPRCSVDVNALYVPRINAALLTLAKADPEVQFVVCKNVQMLLVLLPTLLQNHVDCFYIRFSDPPYVKMEKLKLILRLTTAANAEVVIKELAEYVTEVDLAFVREVVATAAAVAIKVDSVAPRCSQMLLDVVTKRPELITQVITASKNIVRKYPELLVLEPLLRDHGAENVVDEEAKVSLVWMLGEFCDFVENGTSVLQEHFIANLLSHEQSVQLAVLTAVIKVFLRNPVGMEGTLNHVLEQLTTHCVDPDVRDRAYAYWRLLSKGVGVEQMKKIVHGRKPPVDVYRAFSDAVTVGDMRVSLNTAAAVYGKPARSFLQVYGAVDTSNGDASDDDEDLVVEASSEVADVASSSAAEPVTAVAVAPAATVAKRVDPLEGLFAPGPSAPIQQPSASTPPAAVSTVVDIFGGIAAPQQRPATTTNTSLTAAPSSRVDDVLGARTSLSAASVSPAASAPPVLLTAAETDGVVYRAAVSAAHPIPKLTIIIENASAAPVKDFMLQINTNSYGLVPSLPVAECLQPSAVVAPSQRISADLPLRVLDSHFFATRHVLEVAIKSSLGLHRFSVHPPAESMLHVPPPTLDRTGFLHQWKGIEETCEGKMLIPTAATRMLALGASGVKSRLEQCHAVVVADRGTDEQLSIYGGCRTHMGLTALFEIILKKGTPSQSYVCCRSMRVNDVMPAVVNLLEAAFAAPASVAPDVVPAAPPAAKAPFSVEDLFA